MNDVLLALTLDTPEEKAEGVLDYFMRLAREILSTGILASALLASVASIPTDEQSLASDSLIELVQMNETADSEHVAFLSRRLESFLDLASGWNNDDNSKPIDKNVIGFIISALNVSDAADWQRWEVFPEQTGSVLLDYESETCRAGISIGLDGFSYMAYGKGFFDTADRQTLSEGELLSFVRNVKEYGRS